MVKTKYSVSQHQASINKAIDYIERNIYKKIDLEKLAETANLSKYHFLRVFKDNLNETPLQYISRLRVEKAASLLLSRPNDSITNIALEVGFSDMTVFSKNFKLEFGITATQWRGKLNSNFNKDKSNNKLLQTTNSIYICKETGAIKFKSDMPHNKSIEIKELKSFSVAYIRHIGSYISTRDVHEKMWTKLYGWLMSKSLSTQVKPMVIYHDDPGVTAPDKQRKSFCVEIPDDTKGEGEVGKMIIHGGKYLIAKFELLQEECIVAWHNIMNWLPKSGFEADFKECFEVYDPPAENGLFRINIYIPVKK